MNIKGVTVPSLIDWDGEVSYVVFVGDCQFRCPNCHNTALVLRPESLPTLKEQDVIKDIEKNKAYISGVCITGGEPTIQKYLHIFCKKIKKMGLKVKIDTNGKFPMVIDYLLKSKLVDYIAMDIKAPLIPEKYSEATGTRLYLSEMEDICYSIDLIKKSKIDYEFRTTVVPILHTKKDIEEICKYAINGSKKYVLQNFWNLGDMISPELKKIKPFTQKELEDFAETAKKYVKEVKIRSLNI